MAAAEECYRLGTARFPGVSWAWPDFEQAWLGQTDARPGSEDEYIRLACLHGVPGAPAALERHYIEPLRATIRRVCQSDDLTDTALQDLRAKLLLPPAPRLEAYKPTSSLRAWLTVVATRTALDLVRKVAVQGRREAELEERLEALGDQPDERFLDAEQRAVLRSALRAAVKRLPDDQRFALRMHVTADWNIDQIGRVLSVHRATVARWLLSAKAALRMFLHEELGRHAPLSGERSGPLSELPSRLDLSLSRVFATTGVHAVEDQA
jgi:RNA polymerase sigma-70 factor (ECF subfamily)